MPKATQPFRPETRQTRTAAKTVAGVVVSLVVLALSFFLLFFPMSPIPLQSGKLADPPCFYLSAVNGSLFSVVSVGEEEREAEVPLGDYLRAGGRYRCSARGLALIRSTLTEFEATIYEGCTLRMVEKRGGSDKDFVLEKGTLKLRLYGTPGKTALAIGVPGNKLILRPPASVLASVKDEKLHLEVFSGSAELMVDSAAGRQTSYPAGTVVEADLEGSEPKEGALLAAPESVSPATGSVFLKDAGEPLQIDFRWRKVDGANHYQVEVAGDLLFTRPVATRQLSELYFTLADLAEGRYYWRVEALGRGGAHSEPAGPWAFTVRSAEIGRAEIPAAPSLNIGRITAQSNLITIWGQTEPGAHVEVRLEAGGRVIPTERRVIVAPDGSFRHQQPVDVRGIITVIVTAYYRPEKVATVTGEVRVDF
jgi:hypothetical protein